MAMQSPALLFRGGAVDAGVPGWNSECCGAASRAMAAT